MANRIAFLGWGSLLWEGREFDGLHGPWRFDGPRIKLEFSRVSTTRSGALTLVIDTLNGTPNRIAWCLSRRQCVDKAIEDLRRREGTKTDDIGVFGHELSHCQDMETLAAIRSWSRVQKLDYVIWTDLRSNFVERTRNSFSVETAKWYLDHLQGRSKRAAQEYLERAPSFIQTPLRDEIYTVRSGISGAAVGSG
jgi:hypothetical protein